MIDQLTIPGLSDTAPGKPPMVVWGPGQMPKYRYVLRRVWDEAKPGVMFIGLNPSTADEARNDRTMTRCYWFAHDWHDYKYGSMVMTNLFAFRSPYPRVMKAEAEPIGPDNDQWLLAEAERAALIVCAWGTHGPYLSRAAQVLKLLKNKPLYCLDLTKEGHPKHPLYIPAYATPIMYKGVGHE